MNERFLFYRDRIVWMLNIFLFALNAVVWQEVFIKETFPDFRVSFFNVGQGDAAFLESKDGTQILIDGGPDNSVLFRLQDAMPYYDRSIDAVVLTHPDADHVSGLVDVLERYHVNMVFETGVLHNNAATTLFREAIAQKNIQRVIVDRPMLVRFGYGAELLFLSPQESWNNRVSKKINNTSIINELRYQGKTILFMGDAEKSVEKELVQKRMLRDIDILKVGHHGSRTSSASEFLETIRPEHAVISVGKNRYGHPHNEVLAYLKNAGALLWRTDTLGMIRADIRDGALLITNKK